MRETGELWQNGVTCFIKILAGSLDAFLSDAFEFESGFLEQASHCYVVG
jgi:hypothetical protein